MNATPPKTMNRKHTLQYCCLRHMVCIVYYAGCLYHLSLLRPPNSTTAEWTRTQGTLHHPWLGKMIVAVKMRRKTVPDPSQRRRTTQTAELAVGTFLFVYQIAERTVFSMQENHVHLPLGWMCAAADKELCPGIFSVLVY